MNDHPAGDLLSEVLFALEVCICELDSIGRARVVGVPPAWLSRFVDDPSGGFSPAECFLFLEHFLEEAELHWEQHASGHMASTIWSEPDRNGEACHLKAAAVTVSDNRRVLLIELIGVELERRRERIQRAREGKLDAYQSMLDERRRADLLTQMRDELERRVERRTRELVEANARLREAMRVREAAEHRAAELRETLAHIGRVSTMGEMATTLAHELNQPFWAIVNYLQGSRRLLDKSPPPLEQVCEALDKAAAQAERAGRIIRRLRESVTKRPSRRETTDLRALIGEVADLLDRELRDNDVTLEIDPPQQEPAKVVADPVEIQQILVNVLHNAVEAMARWTGERVIRMRVVRVDRFSRLVISDTGPGADDDTLARLFEPFYSTKSNGMGLGLSICRSIAEDHGGSLVAKRRPNGGLEFTLDLPLPETETHDE